jgi:hypothetical protein
MIDEQVRTLATRTEEMEAAKEFLEHVTSHHDAAPDGCPHYETFRGSSPRMGSAPAQLRRGRCASDETKLSLPGARSESQTRRHLVAQPLVRRVDVVADMPGLGEG